MGIFLTYSFAWERDYGAVLFQYNVNAYLHKATPSQVMIMMSTSALCLMLYVYSDLD
jgi:hypothetical protein